MKAPLRPGRPGVWSAYTFAQSPPWWGFYFTSSYYNLRAKRCLRTFNQAMDEAAANVKPPTEEKMRAIYLVDRGHHVAPFWSKMQAAFFLIGFFITFLLVQPTLPPGQGWAWFALGAYIIACVAVTWRAITVNMD